MHGKHVSRSPTSVWFGGDVHMKCKRALYAIVPVQPDFNRRLTMHAFKNPHVSALR